VNWVTGGIVFFGDDCDSACRRLVLFDYAETSRFRNAAMFTHALRSNEKSAPGKGTSARRNFSQRPETSTAAVLVHLDVVQ
jgi:hypothetical protein